MCFGVECAGLERLLWWQSECLSQAKEQKSYQSNNNNNQINRERKSHCEKIHERLLRLLWPSNPIKTHKCCLHACCCATSIHRVIISKLSFVTISIYERGRKSVFSLFSCGCCCWFKACQARALNKYTKLFISKVNTKCSGD